MNLKHLIQPVLRIIAAIILLQTLFFKFSAAPESVYIFSKLGVEPWGRILSGCLELIVAVLLFVRSLRWFAALLGLGIMAGAILAHLT
ncbi:MAG TPA: DoxX family protein, partial [Bacteroidia bacterium]|nr:DoxX family protein [Bacteroidia bacterium]